MDLTVSVLFLMIHFSSITSMETEVIQTETGKVQGVIEPTVLEGKYVQKFLNIPYAEPPVGKLRLTKPQPKKPWNGTIKNSNISIACWQKSHDPNVKLSEDCLILNIWTPYPQKQNLSVMIWFHGGAFLLGKGNDYLGYNFVAVGDVILVTVNFRLSLLGFFTTGDERVKGNFGLFDQRLAMKWVKENIGSFGGDPQSITIFGESSGGASVSAHTLSQESWLHFNRAILQSGLITMPWTISSKEQVKIALNKFLHAVNCTDNADLLECLQSDSADDYLRELTRVPIDLALQRPSVDGEFITDKPATLLREGIIKPSAVMLGVTKDEAYVMGARDLLKNTRNVTEIEMRYQELLKGHFKNSSEAVYDEAHKLYTPACVPSFVEAIRPMVDLGSDLFFTCPAVNEARIRAQLVNYSDIYLYRYSFASAVAMIEYLHHEDTFGFVPHGSDIHSTFGDPIKDPHFPADDQILSMRMILYWTNFAKHGDPNVGVTKLPIVLNKIDSLPMWPKYTNSSREYLEMESLSRMIVGKRLREKHCEFLSDPEGFTNATVSPTSNQPSNSTSPNRAIQNIAQMSVFLALLLQAIF